MVVKFLRLVLILCVLFGTANAQLMCFEDMNMDGFVDAAGESAPCSNPSLCPIDQTACVTGPSGPDPFICPRSGEYINNCSATGGTCQYLDPPTYAATTEACVPNPVPPTCPLDPAIPCVNDGGGSYCSQIACVNTATPGFETIVESPREYIVEDGTYDAAGNCLDQMLIFSGFRMDCRPVGLQTLFNQCCKDDGGQIIKDSSGSSVGGLAMAAEGVGAVFTGMNAAYSTFTLTGSVAAASSAGSSAMLAAIDPTTLAISLAFTLMVDMLNLGCDQEDSETAVLRSSGMCHYIDDYCHVDTIFGCLQKKRTNCCFNSKLGRIIHQQGRSQIASFASLPNGGWGTAENPECRGFTPEEFQALDFGSMDLSEYYGELGTRAATDMQILMNTEVSDYANTNGL